MLADLLEARAAVDWTFAHLPAFHQRIDAWLADNFEVVVKDQPAPATHNVIVALQKAPLPLDFNVEVGAFLNVLRSSLDILASALGRRHSVLHQGDWYFPVARSSEAFANGDYAGNQLVRGLPADETEIIKALKPYQGGNDVLWSLHHLDIVRKHRRLLAVQVRPIYLSIQGRGPPEADFTRIATGHLRDGDETVVGLLRKGAPDYEFRFLPIIAFDEEPFARQPVTRTLAQFAAFTGSVIAMFDGP